MRQASLIAGRRFGKTIQENGLSPDHPAPSFVQCTLNQPQISINPLILK
ncbi:hypothetical protein [Azospirillum thermophilum]|nr:hypothetical protein [Azospirillum thermophilum]